MGGMEDYHLKLVVEIGKAFNLPMQGPHSDYKMRKLKVFIINSLLQKSDKQRDRPI
jgi:hypothetical protein